MVKKEEKPTIIKGLTILPEWTQETGSGSTFFSLEIKKFDQVVKAIISQIEIEQLTVKAIEGLAVVKVREAKLDLNAKIVEQLELNHPNIRPGTLYVKQKKGDVKIDRPSKTVTFQT